MKKQLLYSRIPGRARKRAKISIDVALSASFVSKPFGYRSKSSGSRLRKKYFKMIGEPEKEWRYFPHVDPDRLVLINKPRTVRI